MSEHRAPIAKNRSARGAMIGLMVALVGLALSHRGHSAESVDVRTYVEMIAGIARHGLPYLDNGPLELSPALTVPWGVPRDGHLWGIYAPLYPYLMAPILRVGGLVRVAQATVALLIPIALVTFALARRTWRDERYAALAAVLTVFSTPLFAKSIEISAYPASALFSTATILTAWLTLERDGRAAQGFAFLTGILAAGAVATHPLGFPMVAASLGLLALPISISPEGDVARALWPTRASLLRGTWAAGAFVAGLVPVALLNHLRFGMWNPITYGPTPWRSSSDTGLLGQNMGDHLRYAAPCAFGLALLAAAIWLARSRIWACIAVVALFVAAVASMPWLAERYVRFAYIACGYVIDMSVVPLDPPYKHEAGTFGYVYGNWLIKSLLQCTPVVGLIACVPCLPARERSRALLVLLPSAAMFLSLILRANLPLHSGLGFPWVNLRYILPAAPALVIVAVGLVRLASPPRWSFALAAVCGVALAYVLHQRVWAVGEYIPDLLLFRQILVLVVPLVCAALASAAVVFRRHTPKIATGVVMAATLGVGIGIAIGHDYDAHRSGVNYCDGRLDTVAAVTPQRFAVIGHLGELDYILALRATRDIEYADLYQLPDWVQIRPLMEHWTREGRPIFVAWYGPELISPWGDIAMVKVPGAERLFRVEMPHGP